MSDLTETDKRTIIRIKPKGSAKIEGDFLICDMDGNDLAPGATKVSLCRCGISDIMPFCDGRHKAFGFNGKWEFKSDICRE